MIVLGIILLLIGYFTSLSILYTIAESLWWSVSCSGSSAQWAAPSVIEKSGSNAPV